jgi:hypothetical protein
MFHLPRELQNYIYLFDLTYHNIFRDCLFDISNKSNVHFVFNYKRTSFSPLSLIEIYKFKGVSNNKKCLIDFNKRYKFLVDKYFFEERYEFNHFYKWFYKNLDNVIKPIERVFDNFV